MAIALAGALGAGIAAACSDPYGGDDPGVTVPVRDGAAEAQGSTQEPSDAALVDDAITVDAQKADASGCITCDCDGDGFNRAGCDAGPDPGPIDCDDQDFSRHPGQTYVATLPPSDQLPPGDWDCSNTVENLYPVNQACSAFNVACDTHSGFLGAPGCGASGDYVQCKLALGGLSCTASSTTKRTQSCR